MNTRRYSVNHWLLDYPAGTIAHLESGEVRRLGEYQIKLLYCLAQHAGQTLSRHELTALVWERRVIGNNSLSNAIHALRVALEDDGKLQRVIKTIPRRGYLLDAEFCQVLEPGAEELPVQVSELTALPPEDVTPPVSPSLPVIPLRAEPAPRGIARLRTIPSAIYLAGFIGLLMLIGSGWYASFIHHADFTWHEQGKNRFSNVRIHRIALTSDNIEDAEFIRFKSVFEQINQKLISRNAALSVYYRTTEQMLNYTFVIETPCARKQLAMTLYHWRIDNQKLNDIIYRETERVLNEMAPCKK